MTNEELIAKIKTEIERLKNQLVRGACAAQIEMETNCKEEAYDEVLSFLNAIETEEPVPNDLEEAADEFANQDCVTFISRKNGFIAGAEWQENKDQETIELAEDHAFLAGADWQREQMIKEAVEGYVTLTLTGVRTVAATIKGEDNIGPGDKVRIIIVKE